MSEAARELLPPEERATPDRTTPVDVSVRSIALTVLAGSAAMYVLWWAQEVFIPIVLSVLISYALEPAVLWLVRLRLPRTLASALVVALLSGVIGYGMYALYDEGAQIVGTLPQAAQQLRTVLRRGGSKTAAIQQVKQAAEELQKTADEATGGGPSTPRGVQRVEIVQPAFNVRDYLTWGSASVLAFSGQAVLIIFFVFFLLASGDLFKRKMVKVVGSSLAKKKITVQILDEINTQIELFLFVRVITSTVVGVATWLAFRYVGLQQAGFWGVCAGVFNSVPYFGPIIVAAGTAVVSFLQFGTLTMAVYVAGLSILITSLEGWLLTPWLTSRTARTNEVAIFVALIFWSFVWGIWGTLLAVPMLVVMKACCDRIEDLKGVGELLGE